MASVGKRTKNIVKNQLADNTNQTVKLNSSYIGFVKDNSDALKMRRIKVWIPELSPDPINGLYTVNWCSPFAGATPIQDSDKTNTSQTSYGLWFSPPDIDNEVVVMFINGDPNRGVYIGGLYQQNMNHMVPGIPTSTMTESVDVMGDSGPAQEYNKRNKSIASKADNHPRPSYTPLVEALVNQGLHQDNIRGMSTSGARRNTVSNVSGILTPGGNQFVMDDDDDNKFIRLRTPNGTQIVINDTVGIIYMITRSGNSWLELSDSGINSYTTGNYSVRCHGDYNVHADGDINMFSGKYTNIASNQGISISSTESFDLISGNLLSMSSAGQISIVTTADMNLQGAGDIGVDAGGTLALRACTQIGLTACDSIGFKATSINNNTGTPKTPGTPVQATVKNISSISDLGVTSGGTGSSTTTKSIVSTLVTHEPFAGHITTAPGPATISSDGSITYTKPNLSTDSTKTPSTSWIFPVTGTVVNDFSQNKNGIIIKSITGYSIISPKNGSILLLNTNSSDGSVSVTIDHFDNTYSILTNIYTSSIKVGDNVVQGQTIGKVGNVNGTANVIFSIKSSGTLVDPSVYFSNITVGNLLNAGSS